MIGIIKEEKGIAIKKENFMTVKKVLQTDETIPRHNHPDKEIIFIVVKGEIEVTLNQTEKHLLVPGKLLSFNGAYTIEGLAKQDTEIFITLIG